MPTPELFDLSGHVALVTGGNGGIGRAIALGLARAGAAVAILARNEEKNQRVMTELQQSELPHWLRRLMSRRVRSCDLP